MKRKLILFLTIGLAFISMALMDSSFDDNTSKTLENRYKQRVEMLTKELLEFRLLLNSSSSKKDILHKYRMLRKAFKQWEYLGEWETGNLIKESINGAPLPKLEKNSFGSNVLEPHGLQVIDGLIGDWDEKTIRESVLNEINLLLNVIRQISTDTRIYEFEFFAAARIELIRMFSLGLSGFDTPGTLLSIADAHVVWEILQTDFEVFSEKLNNENRSLNQQITDIFKVGNSLLKRSDDFEKFNRYQFLKEAINPLYLYLDSARSVLEIEKISETQSLPMGWNENSRNIFDADFLNIDFYSRLPNQFNTPNTVNLGRQLFFDSSLSKNGKMSCGSCHNPDLAFTDGIPKSKSSVESKTVKRNAMTLYNCVFSERFFWDLRTDNILNQMEHVISDSLEFATSMINVIQRLNQSESYKNQFRRAFHIYEGEVINPQTISFAFTAYISSLNSFNSIFDRLVRNEITMKSKNIENGFNLFMGKAACGTCHFIPTFSGLVPPFYTESESEVLGVPEFWPVKNAKLDTDLGRINSRMKETASFFSSSFKTVTLRNVALTAPYMHNGGFKNLRSVIDFYNQGGGIGIGLEVSHQTLGSSPLKLTNSEISDLIAFMESLTDIQHR